MNGLREYDAAGHENRAASGGVRNRDFHARDFRILIPAAKTDPAFRQILANSDFLLEATPPNASQDARPDACAVSARKHTRFVYWRREQWSFRRLDFRKRLDPDGGRIALLAETSDAP